MFGFGKKRPPTWARSFSTLATFDAWVDAVSRALRDGGHPVDVRAVRSGSVFLVDELELALSDLAETCAELAVEHWADAIQAFIERRGAPAPRPRKGPARVTANVCADPSDEVLEATRARLGDTASGLRLQLWAGDRLGRLQTIAFELRAGGTLPVAGAGGPVLKRKVAPGVFAVLCVRAFDVDSVVRDGDELGGAPDDLLALALENEWSTASPAVEEAAPGMFVVRGPHAAVLSLRAQRFLGGDPASSTDGILISIPHQNAMAVTSFDEARKADFAALAATIARGGEPISNQLFLKRGCLWEALD